MGYDKIFESFLNKIQEEGTYANRLELEQAILPTLEIIKKNKDATIEELTEKMIKENISYLENILSSYPVPGYTVGIKVGNINIKLLGGVLDINKRQMREDALFDLASITKLYTQIIAYNLIKEKIFSLDDKIKDLDSRFANVRDLTIKDILTFTTTFKTDERLASKRTIEEAKDCLYNINVISTNMYNYNDMGLMILTEVMEKVTGKTYQELVDYFIINKLGLKDTHLVIPKTKIERFTGSANMSLGLVNDPSALSVGGYSGHAGMIASSDDLITLGRGIVSGTIFPKESLSDTYTPGFNIVKGGKDYRGIIGNTYTAHENGVKVSYVDHLASKKEFAVQGSTKTLFNISPNSISTILLNPCAMGLERAKKEEEKININRIKDGLMPLSLVKEYYFERKGHEVNYHLIDARQMVPNDTTLKYITTLNTIAILRLRFLNEIIKEYDKNYDKEIQIVKKAR